MSGSKWKMLIYIRNWRIIYSLYTKGNMKNYNIINIKFNPLVSYAINYVIIFL